MLVSENFRTRLFINKQAIDDALMYGGLSHKEQCEIHKFDYELFKRIYNNDLNVTVKELMSFGHVFGLYLAEFVILM